MEAREYGVVRAERADLESIMELERAGFPAGIVEDEAVFAARMAAFPAGFVLLKEKAGGGVRGYLCAERWGADPGPDAGAFSLGHDPAPRCDPKGTVLYLASMTVHPDLRGAGLGALLFRDGRRLIAADAPGLERELLIVNEEWTGARRIYEAAGFAAAASFPGFFRREGSPGRAAILMARDRKEQS